MSNPDRRRAQRIAVQQLVSVVLGDGGYEVPFVIENFSPDGALLYADQFIQEGTQIGLIVALPPTETEAEGKRVWCCGEVVRVEKELKEGKFGVAVVFQRYQLLSQA